MIKYTITIDELIKRPIIREDQPYEFLNKMTDIEINKFENEVDFLLIEENISRKFPDWNVGVLTKFVDFSIFYELYKTFNKN